VCGYITTNHSRSFTMLFRFDPFRELDRMTPPSPAPRPAPMPLDAFRRGSDVVINFDLPGIDPESVDVTVDKNVLKVTAERSWTPREGDEVVVAERPQGRFSRQLFLGDSLAADRVAARFDLGVLTVTIPVAESAKPRKVEITGAERRQPVAAGSAASN
jgi:HSP20 family protein